MSDKDRFSPYLSTFHQRLNLKGLKLKMLKILLTFSIFYQPCFKQEILHNKGKK